jgi:hypothetical protein
MKSIVAGGSHALFFGGQSETAKRGHRARDELHPNNRLQKPLRLGAAGGACAWAVSGLTSIHPSRISSFAFELEIVSSFPVSMFRTVRNRTWFIEAPPRLRLTLLII